MRPRSPLQERVCEVSQPSDGFPSPISLSTFLWYSKSCSVSSYLWSRGCTNINDYSKVSDLRLLFFHTQASLGGWPFLPSRSLPFTRRRNDYFDSRAQWVPKLWQRPCNGSECGQKGPWRWSTWASSNGAASRHGHLHTMPILLSQCISVMKPHVLFAMSAFCFISSFLLGYLAYSPPNFGVYVSPHCFLTSILHL